ncbi:hypothetical protein GGR57DRAFT_456139 [Xylariaceae sp. FL1272]|nr:hypothetical protein GGR57DRAFT_456139 [Xylariaceae sp. FL1272]
MFDQFEWRHVPSLFVASVTTVGVLWPITNPRRALLTFGFPNRIAESPAAAPVMLIAQIRTTILGLAMWLLYFKGNLESLDVIMAVYGTAAGIVDSYAVWKQGNTSKAIFRLTSSWALAAYGWAGMTSGR